MRQLRRGSIATIGYLLLIALGLFERQTLVRAYPNKVGLGQKDFSCARGVPRAMVGYGQRAGWTLDIKSKLTLFAQFCR